MILILKIMAGESQTIKDAFDTTSLEEYRKGVKDYDTVYASLTDRLIAEHLIVDSRSRTPRYQAFFESIDQMLASPSHAAQAIAYDFEVSMLRSELTREAILALHKIDPERARLAIYRTAQDDGFWVPQTGAEPLPKSGLQSSHIPRVEQASESDKTLDLLYEEDRELYFELTRGLVRRHSEVDPGIRPQHAALITREFTTRMHEDINFWLSDDGLGILVILARNNPILHVELLTHLYEYANRIGVDAERMIGIDHIMETALDSSERDFERYYGQFERYLYAEYIDTGRIDELITLLDEYRVRGADTSLICLCNEFERRLLRTDKGYQVVRRLLTRSNAGNPVVPLTEPATPKDEKEDWVSPFEKPKKEKKPKQPSKKELEKQEAQRVEAERSRTRFNEMLNRIITDDETFKYTGRDGRLNNILALDREVYSELMRAAAARLADDEYPYSDVSYLAPGLERYASNVDVIGQDHEYWATTQGVAILSDLYFRNRDLYRMMLVNLAKYCRESGHAKPGYTEFFDTQRAIYDVLENDQQPEELGETRVPSLHEVVVRRIRWMLKKSPPPFLSLEGEVIDESLLDRQKIYVDEEGFIVDPFSWPRHFSNFDLIELLGDEGEESESAVGLKGISQRLAGDENIVYVRRNLAWIRWYTERAALFDGVASLRTVQDFCGLDDFSSSIALPELDAQQTRLLERYPSERERRMFPVALRLGGMFKKQLDMLLTERVGVDHLQINNDIVAGLMVAATISAILQYSHDEMAREDIIATTGTAENIAGLTASQREKLEKIREIMARIPRWGFEVTGDREAKYTHNAISMFRMLTSRGAGVTVKITPQGLIIHNPLHQLGDMEEKKMPDGSTKQVRENDGGEDYIIVRWGDIVAGNIEINFTPLTDILMGVVSKSMFVTDGKLGEPSMQRLIERGPGSVKITIPQRNKELVELPPVKYPRVFADLIKELAKIMLESPLDGVALIAHLSGATPPDKK